MQRSHKIRLYPNNRQATYFAKAAGCSRFAFNWGLAEWRRQYDDGGKPSAYGLKRQFNSIKRDQFPWMTEVTKCAPERAFADLDRAFKNFFRRVKSGQKPGYPRFKKKGRKTSFYISAQYIKVERTRIYVPKLGWVKMRESLRFSGRIQSVVVSRNAVGWFASISVDLTDSLVSENQTRKAVGVDLGVKYLAVTSDGRYFSNPKSTNKHQKRVRRLNKSLARKVKGSSNWRKARLKLGKLHYEIACLRRDTSHKLTSFLASTYTDVCIEDLNVSGMVKNRKLSKAVSDSAFAEIRRQLAYKCQNLHVVSRWFPSTKLCPECGQIKDVKLSERTYCCECGYGPIDRDLHAARNILREGFPCQPVERPALALSLAVA
jgi:putative transposase